MKYRLVIQWHRAPDPKELAILKEWFGPLTANNRRFLVERGQEIMRVLRNVKQCSTEENVVATVADD